MLFLLKRRWQSSLAALAILAALGFGLRWLLPAAPPFDVTAGNTLLGLAVFAAILVSDGLLHGALCLAFGDGYRRRYRQLVGEFRGQTVAAMLAGALMAGVGEE